MGTSTFDPRHLDVASDMLTGAVGSDAGRLDALVQDALAARGDIARAQVREARVLAAALDLVLERCRRRAESGDRRSGNDLPLREVSAELAAALRLSDRSVQRRMGDAAVVVGDYPATLAAWERAEIDAGHVAAILDAGVGLDDAGRSRYESLVLDAARHETAGRLQGLARLIAARVDPEGAAERASTRKLERRVRVMDLDDGMARLFIDLPATLAYAILDRLTRMARTVREGTVSCTAEASETDADAGGAVVTGSSRHADTNADVDSRTLDQLRTDILSDLVLAGTPMAHGDGLDAVVGHVQVTVPVLTLAGASEEPAILDGQHPIDAETARRLAGAASGWDRVLTHPHSGAVLAVDRYRPGADLLRLLRARDQRCRFPGCRRAARGCDVDHTHDAARGGPTRADNLGHLCRRHHTLKHQTAWRVRQLPGGVIEWRSPTGRAHRDRPPSTVAFVPDTADGFRGTDPPPF